MKRSIIALTLLVMTFALIFIQSGCTKPPSPEELKASIELTELDTKWVKKFYFPWPPKLILVPAISFRIKNLTDKPLRYVNFNAIFKLVGEQENLGDCYLAAIRKTPVMPGELSDTILLKSNTGVEGKNLESFKNNPFWKTAMVKLFIQSKGSIYVLLGEWEISKKIDFEEPEPYQPVKKEEKFPSW